MTLDTNLAVARRNYNSTLALAEGEARQVTQRALARATVLRQTGAAETGAYGAAKERLELSNEQLLQYIWWDGIDAGGGLDGEGAASADLLVGVPAVAFTSGSG